MARACLLGILQDLDSEELSKFHWSMRNNSSGKIKKNQLEDSKTRESLTRQATVDLLVQIYTDGAVQFTKTILEEIQRNDLVAKLTDTGSGAKGATATRVKQSQEAEVAEEKLMFVKNELSQIPDTQDYIAMLLVANRICRYEDLESVRARILQPQYAQITMDVVRDKLCSDTLNCRIYLDLQLNFTHFGQSMDKLMSVRREFIYRISEANLNSLLHKLLYKKCINDKEIQTVRGKDFRLDKAREVIDMVHRKGIKASSEMIEMIHQLDPYLSEQLFLDPPISASAQIGSEEGQNVTMENKLLSVREEFIMRISDGNLNSLLNKLLYKHVINDKEIEVVRGNFIRSERARGVINIVRKKGNKASSEMIDMIHQLDPYLSEQLFLGPPSLMQPGAQIGSSKEGQNVTMANKLLSVRSDFIERISEPNLNSLLHKLLYKNVINDKEIETVREKHLKVERAREVIVMVQRKGNKASSEMIDMIHQLDPYLSEQLFLDPPMSASAQIGSKEGQNVTMENKLRSVRIDFIERISEPNLNSLLLKLLYKNVINDKEIETVREKNGKAERAREVISMLQRKGNKASSEMIDMIHQVDPYLSEQLFLGPPGLRQPSAHIGSKESQNVTTEHKLGSVRIDFMERISEATLNSLQQKLLYKNVINDKEIESINEKNITTTRAKVVIDMVRRKGNKASSVMIDTIHQLDPYLAEELFLGPYMLEPLPQGAAVTQQNVTMENNAEEMGEMLRTDRAQVDMVRKRGNRAGLEMTDMVHQLNPNMDPNLSERLPLGSPLQASAQIGPMGGLEPLWKSKTILYILTGINCIVFLFNLLFYFIFY